MKKVISVVGARPNFMKVAPIDRSLKKYSDKIQHLIVHTGQHYDKSMSDAFFNDLEMPHPSYFLGVGSGSHAEQTARVMIGFEKVLLDVNPDLVIVVGDVNSTVACALTAVKMQIPVIHIEAGLRSYDRNMPEEINRMATDAICDYCFVTEESGMKNLLHDGFPEEKIFFVGNTMIDTQCWALDKSEKSNILSELNLNPKEFVLITLHRPSNVDDSIILKMFIEIFEKISESRKVVFPVHPRTRKNISLCGFSERVENNPNLIFIDPLGYVDFLTLMKNSDFVITDSGGIQEETTALGIQCLTVRTTTERPITVEIGTNQLIQPEYDLIIEAADKLISGNYKS